MTPETILYIIIAALVAIGLAAFMYGYKSKYTGTLKWLFGILRALTLFTILFLLINPSFKSDIYTLEKPKLAVMVDDSQSIKSLESNFVVNQLVDDIKADADLQDQFDISYYKFSDGISSLDSLKFLEKNTNVSKALKEVASLYKEQNAPVLLITDGNQTVGEDYKFSSQRLKNPVYPIVVGDTTRYEDVYISQINTNRYSFLNNKFPVEAIVNYTGTASVNSKFVVQQNGKTVFSEAVSFSKNQRSKRVSFTLNANAVGFQKYTAQILPISSEKNKRNNTSYFAVEVIDQSTNVLIVSKIIHPDLGALKKSIEANKQRKVSIKEPSEAVSLLNDSQLVILYQPDRSFAGVYSEIEKLEKNTLTLTGLNTDWNFLNSTQSYFNKEVTSATEEATAKLNPNFSAFSVDYSNFENLPPLKTLFGGLEITVPHEVLLEQYIDGFASETPLLATIENNGQRHVIMDGEDIWKWRSATFVENESFEKFDAFLGKMVQFAASTKRRSRLEVSYESFYYNNKPIRISAQYFDKNFVFDTRMPLSITITNKTTKEKKVFPMLLRNNFFEVDISTLPPSEYRFTVATDDNAVARSGTFTIIGYEVEKQFGNADVTNLRHLATNTGGNVFLPSQLRDLKTTFKADNRFKPIQKSELKTVSLVDWKYLLGLLAILLALEWFIRKYNGLI